MSFRFTIRDIIWVSCLIVVIVSWRVDHSRASTMIAEDGKRIEQLGSKIDDYVEYLNDLRAQYKMHQPTESSENSASFHTS